MVQPLTDEIILKYAPDALTEWRDFKLNYKGGRIVPYTGGLYDPSIFGSLFERQCNCGTVKTQGATCYSCGAKVLDDKEKYKRFARIELPVYYCLDVRFDSLLSFVKEQFKGGVVTDFHSELFKKASSKGVGRNWQMIFDMCQFSYDKKEDALVATDIIEDSGKCSYEGLLEIFLKYKKEAQPTYSSFINAQLLVPPIVMRPVQKDFRSAKKLRIHDINYIYKAVLWLSQKLLPDMEAQAKTPAAQALLRGVARIFINKCVMKASQLFRSSKENLARNLADVRMPSSGRGTIIPDLNLTADEVGLPRHLVYEACRKEFTAFLAKKFDCNDEQANFLYKSQARSEEVQALFDDFINGNPEEGRKGKYAMVSRAPVLFEYGVSCAKIKLVDDYAMHLPIAVCKPYNGDFDGDTMAWFIISDEFTDIAIERMSPRNRIYYKKNGEPLYMPEQDILSGLIIGTRTQLPKGNKLMDFDTVENAMEYRSNNPEKLKFTTLVTIGGKQTTIARAKLSELFDVDIDAYLESYDGKPEDKESLNGKNIVPLYAGLETKPDRLERIRDIQNFAALLETVIGVTALSIEELTSMPMKSRNLDRIKRLYKDDRLTDLEKNVSIREEYHKYVDDVTGQLKPKHPDIVQKVTETAKSKIDQLLELISPQINSDLNGDVLIGTSIIAEGLSERDFVSLNIEQRGIQDIMSQGTPMAGYLTRQVVYIGNRFTYTDRKSDPKNPGIWLPRKKAVGRMTLDGKRVPPNNDDKPVMVVSCVTSTRKDSVITSDMVASPDKYRFKDGDNIGFSWSTQITEALTQSALGLKHGGRLKNLDYDARLVAPFDCTLEVVDDKWLDLTSMDGKVTKRYPRPLNWVRNWLDTEYYPQGECVGYAYQLFAPQVTIELIISLVHAHATDMPKWYERNKIQHNQCYALNDGKVHYEWTDVGVLRMYIGDREYKMNPYCLCYFAEGDMVKRASKYSDPVRTASGLVDMTYVMEEYKKDIAEVFYVFREQFTSLWGKLNPELVEFLFKIIISVDEKHRFVIKSFDSTLANNSGFFTRVSFQRAKDAFRDVGPEGAELGDDIMTMSIIPLILNGELV